jgi:predicted RNA methylase
VGYASKRITNPPFGSGIWDCRIDFDFLTKTTDINADIHVQTIFWPPNVLQDGLVW